MNLEELLSFVKQIALDAGAVQMKYFRTNELGVQTKSNESDVVTKVDKECEKLIVDAIKSRFPEHRIMGEEGGLYDGDSEYQWVIDPLDGTNNYSQGLPVFVVSIGLQKCGETLLGVVYAPYLDEMYTAIKGGGAYLNDNKISVSNKNRLEISVLATGFPYDKGINPDNNLDNLNKILPHLRGIRRMGAAAYDLCCVAAGFFDGYWELSLNLWDICAGVLIVEEAGGFVRSFRDDRNHSIIAANKDILDIIYPIISK